MPESDRSTEGISLSLDALTRAVRPRLRGVLHQWAFVVSLVAGSALVVHAGSPRGRVAVAIYAVSLAACLGMSALYHRPDWTPRRKRQMKKLDHSTIFLLIAGTYTPIAAIALPPVLAVLSLVAIWVAAALGVVMAVFWADPPMILEVGAYLTMGTVGLLLIPALLTTIGIVGVLLLAAGGGLYWCGAVVYARHRPDPWPATFGFHEVFHVFVVLAASTHFLAIALVTAR